MTDNNLSNPEIGRKDARELPSIGSREDWLVQRRRLLEMEKELVRQKDAVSAERRRLPMVVVDKDYSFEGPSGPASLIDLFEGRRQLIVQHFMFDPSWTDGCPSCTGTADDISSGLLSNLRERNSTFAAVSRAPLAKIEAYKARRGWSFPWYSSNGSSFNYDFHVTLDEAVAPLEYNYRTKDDYLRLNIPSWDFLKTLAPGQPVEVPGYSCFLRHGDRVYHTYSTYARGTEFAVVKYAFLDLTALGRQDGG